MNPESIHNHSVWSKAKQCAPLRVETSILPKNIVVRFESKERKISVLLPFKAESKSRVDTYLVDFEIPFVETSKSSF